MLKVGEIYFIKNYIHPIVITRVIDDIFIRGCILMHTGGSKMNDLWYNNKYRIIKITDKPIPIELLEEQIELAPITDNKKLKELESIFLDSNFKYSKKFMKLIRAIEYGSNFILQKVFEKIDE